MHYLRRVIRPQRLEIGLRATHAIQQLKTAQKVAELRPFLRLCDVLRQFVSNFVHRAARPNSELQKDQPKQIRALNDEKRKMAKPHSEKTGLTTHPSAILRGRVLYVKYRCL